KQRVSSSCWCGDTITRQSLRVSSSVMSASVASRAEVSSMAAAPRKKTSKRPQAGSSRIRGSSKGGSSVGSG
ncbi:Hypothetical predicted protein, partial [Marmota monax]